MTASAAIAARTSWPVHILFALYGFAFAVGTNFIGEWYYPLRGIGWLDLLLMAHFFWLLLIGDRRFPVWVLHKETRGLAYLMLALVFWLLVSTFVNTTRYTLEARDLLAILRLLYFIVLILFVSRYVERHGFVLMVFGYMAGAALMFYQDYSTLTDENLTLEGVRILSNPNVVGAQLGISAFLCSLGVIAGREKIFLLLAMVFTALSITTFSKGTWLLIALGLMANVVALKLATGKDCGRRRGAWLYICAFMIAGCAVLVQYWDTVRGLIGFKLASTEDIGSFSTRGSALLGGMYAGLENPLFGLGYGNYYKVQWLYPELLLPTLQREDNAHNLFGQIAAVGGIPALVLLLMVMVAGFSILRKVLRERVSGHALVKQMYFALSVAVFFLFASVQLQLIAQPSFWFYCAVLLGWKYSHAPPPAPAVTRAVAQV